MTLSIDDRRALADIAAAAAAAAGRLIAGSAPPPVERKAGGDSLASQVVTEIDRRSQALILDALESTRQRFGLGVLTEEAPDSGERHRTDYFWCIDPLDGTLPFVESCPGYAVSIALVAADGTPQLGVIYDPVTDTLVQAVRGAGIAKGGRPWAAPTAPSTRLAMFTDRSITEWPDYNEVLAALHDIADDRGLSGVDIDTTAAAVINACRVLECPPACYFKFPKPRDGGGSVWDYAATACLFTEAGAVVSDIHGAPLDLNRADSTFMSHRGVVFATDQALARSIRALWVDGAFSRRRR